MVLCTIPSKPEKSTDNDLPSLICKNCPDAMLEHPVLPSGLRMVRVPWGGWGYRGLGWGTLGSVKVALGGSGYLGVGWDG